MDRHEWKDGARRFEVAPSSIDPKHLWLTALTGKGPFDDQVVRREILRLAEEVNVLRGCLLASGHDLGVARGDLAASEARGRQYCLELAEKAGEIRELQAERDALKADHEQGLEIVAELSGTVAFLCISGRCPGHLGPKSAAAAQEAADWWQSAWKALGTLTRNLWKEMLEREGTQELLEEAGIVREVPYTSALDGELRDPEQYEPGDPVYILTELGRKLIDEKEE